MVNAFNDATLQIPDGRYADVRDMEEFGKTLQSFIQQQEAALDQVSDDAHHNEIVDFLELLAHSYNEQLHIFKRMEIERQRQLLAEIMQSNMLRPSG